MRWDTPKINPKYAHHCESCTCLGQVTINDVSADLFICDDLAIARFSDAPDDYEATHLSKLDMRANVFLITAFRLYLEQVDRPYVRASIIHDPRPLES